MPTYATTASFDLTIDDIAEEAYERCGLQVRSGYDLQTARRSLNLLLAEWANRGLNLWTIQLQEKTSNETWWQSCKKSNGWSYESQKENGWRRSCYERQKEKSHEG